VEAVFRQSPQVTLLPLKLREASLGLEVRVRSQDTPYAGWIGQKVADLERHLFIEDIVAVAEER
jgi:hypothetical protein